MELEKKVVNNRKVNAAILYIFQDFGLESISKIAPVS